MPSSGLAKKRESGHFILGNNLLWLCTYNIFCDYSQFVQRFLKLTPNLIRFSPVSYVCLVTFSSYIFIVQYAACGYAQHVFSIVCSFARTPTILYRWLNCNITESKRKSSSHTVKYKIKWLSFESWRKWEQSNWVRKVNNKHFLRRSRLNLFFLFSKDFPCSFETSVLWDY